MDLVSSWVAARTLRAQFFHPVLLCNKSCSKLIRHEWYWHFGIPNKKNASKCISSTDKKDVKALTVWYTFQRSKVQYFMESLNHFSQALNAMGGEHWDNGAGSCLWVCRQYTADLASSCLGCELWPLTSSGRWKDGSQKVGITRRSRWKSRSRSHI